MPAELKKAELSMTINWSELGEPINEIFCFGFGGRGGGASRKSSLEAVLGRGIGKGGTGGTEVREDSAKGRRVVSGEGRTVGEEITV
jgi:hypothetical protein